MTDGTESARGSVEGHMANENEPKTEFGDGGVGSQKQGFVGNDAGALSDEQKLPDENPNLMEDAGSLRKRNAGENREGQPDAGMGSSTSLTDAQRHSGLSGGEASISD